MKMIVTDEQLLELLEGVENPELELQIANDKELQRRVAELKEVLTILDGAQEVDVPQYIGRALQSAIVKEEVNQSTQWPWLQVAAAVTLLVVGFSLGKWSGNDLESRMELADLRNEVQSLKEVTLTSTLQRHSASERIMAVNRIEETPTINQELLSTLISTLNSDESPNVRYAALQAIKKFIMDEGVRAELVKSLESQSDPLIQISLITILVEAEEKSVIVPLKEIINDQEIAPEVRQQAEVALKVLT